MPHHFNRKRQRRLTAGRASSNHASSELRAPRQSECSRQMHKQRTTREQKGCNGRHEQNMGARKTLGQNVAAKDQERAPCTRTNRQCPRRRPIRLHTMTKVSTGPLLKLPKQRCKAMAEAEPRRNSKTAAQTADAAKRQDSRQRKPGARCAGSNHPQKRALTVNAGALRKGRRRLALWARQAARLPGLVLVLACNCNETQDKQ